MLRRFALPPLFALVVASLLATSRAHAAPVLLDRLVALVDGEPIFRSEVLARIAEGTHPPKETLERMIDERVIEKEAKRLRIEVYKTEIDAALYLLADKYTMTRADLLALAKKQGLDEAGYREELRRQLLEAKWLQREHPADEKKTLANGFRAAAFVEVKW